MIDIKNLKKGDKVFCILNSNTCLKIGKDYLIEEIYHDKIGTDIVIKENGKFRYYSLFRFVAKDKFRDFLINEIDSEFSIIGFCKNISKIIELRLDDVISYHETLEKISELFEQVNLNKIDFELNYEIFEDENLYKLKEEK